MATAVLLDPVDGSSMTPESEAYPSAAKALAGCDRPLLVVGECG